MEGNSSRIRFLKAVGIGFIFIFIALLLTAGIFHLFSINENFIPSVLNFIVVLTSLIVGISASKSALDKGYQNGMLAGLIFGGAYILVSIFLNGADFVGILVKLLIILIVSTFGGIIGINLKKKKR